MYILDLQEAQHAQKRLVRQYAALDRQALTEQEAAISRYSLNNSLLGHIFSGPGPLPEPNGMSLGLMKI
jgi:hypothetical protein